MTTRRLTLVAIVLLTVLGGRPGRADPKPPDLRDRAKDMLLLEMVVDGVDLLPEPREKLRAAVAPEVAPGIGLDHRGFPRPCERANAAGVLVQAISALQDELGDLLAQSRAQATEEARALVPSAGLVVGRRTLTGAQAVDWILAHPAKYSFSLADRRTLDRQAIAAVDRVVQGATKSIKAAVRSCEKASQ